MLALCRGAVTFGTDETHALTSRRVEYVRNRSLIAEKEPAREADTAAMVAAKFLAALCPYVRALLAGEYYLFSHGALS